MNLVKIVKTAFTQPVRSFKAGWNVLNPPVPKNVVKMTFPLTRGATGAVSVGKKVIGGIKQIAQRLTVNPLAGHTLKSAGKKIGLGALGTLGTFEAFQAARSVGSGESYNPFSGLIGKGKVALAAAFNPIAAYAGLGVGAGEKIASTTTFKDFQPISPNVPVIPTMPTPEFMFPEIPQASFAPTIGGASFVSPSGSVTMPSGPEINPMLILAMLGLVGGAGYAIGRRRKKKKYKRSKKR